MDHAARLRMLSLGSAALLVTCTAITAVTMRFEMLAFAPPPDPSTIEVQTPDKDPPPPTPPEPRPIQTQTPRDDFTPIATPDPVAPVQPIETIIPIDTGPREITQPHWIQRPDGRDFARHYPPVALRRDREGRVVLDCIVSASGRLSCSVASETPEGWGFGAAALAISQYFQMSPMLEDGQPAEGGRVRVPISFRLSAN